MFKTVHRSDFSLARLVPRAPYFAITFVLGSVFISVFGSYNIVIRYHTPSLHALITFGFPVLEEFFTFTIVQQDEITQGHVGATILSHKPLVLFFQSEDRHKIQVWAWHIITEHQIHAVQDFALEPQGFAKCSADKFPGRVDINLISR